MPASSESIVLNGDFPSMAEFGAAAAGGGAAVIVNETGLPDREIRQVIAERWLDIAEISAFTPGAMGSMSARQSTPANLFVRSSYNSPRNVIEEMELALRLYEEDDAVGRSVDAVAALMFAGMRNLHEDEDTTFRFNAIAKEINLDLKLRELMTGLLLMGQQYPVKMFSSKVINNFSAGANPRVIVPNIVQLNPMSVRVVDATDADNPILVQEVDQATHEFLIAIGKGAEGGAGGATAEVKRSDNPVAAQLYTEQFIPNDSHRDDPLLSAAQQAWFLNPRMVKRYIMHSNSSQGKYAPLLLKRIFGLAEAKRLLNLLDYTLLNGAVNFLIVVRKGSDAYPAVQEEVDNLQGLVSRAARTGVIVGDHRLDVEIITPQLDSMFSAEKRNLLDKKIEKSIFRMPDFDWGRVEGGGTPETAIAEQVLASDRLIVKRWIERDIYDETVLRNKGAFTKGAPKIWLPPIMLGGRDLIVDTLLKLRDRGDIPRTWVVTAAGYDADAALADRKRELAQGWDETMTAANVPSTGANPANTGRPNRADGGGTGDTNNDPVNNPQGGGGNA